MNKITQNFEVNEVPVYLVDDTSSGQPQCRKTHLKYKVDFYFKKTGMSHIRVSLKQLNFNIVYYKKKGNKTIEQRDIFSTVRYRLVSGEYQFPLISKDTKWPKIKNSILVFTNTIVPITMAYDIKVMIDVIVVRFHKNGRKTIEFNYK